MEEFQESKKPKKMKKERKKKRLVEIKSSHNVFKGDHFANLPFMEDLGNNRSKVYSVRLRPRM